VEGEQLGKKEERRKEITQEAYNYKEPCKHSIGV
jgi:hypothetical protein